MIDAIPMSQKSNSALKTTLAWVALLTLFVLLFAVACGGEEFVIPKEKPTKDALFGVLRSLHASLEAKNYTSALDYLVEFPGMSDEKMQKAAAGFIEKKEIWFMDKHAGDAESLGHASGEVLDALLALL